MGNHAYQKLESLGLDENEIKIYLVVLNSTSCTIAKIAEKLPERSHLSYSQIHYNLIKLEKKRMIEILAGNPIKAVAISPRERFLRFSQEYHDKFDPLEEHLQDLYDRSHLRSGECTLQLNHFYFNKPEFGFEIIRNRFFHENITSIHCLACPPVVLAKLKYTLEKLSYQKIEFFIHYSIRDFEELQDYKAELKSILSNCEYTIIEHEYRNYESIAVNDEFTRVGHLFVDLNTMVDFTYFYNRENPPLGQFSIDFIVGFVQSAPIIKSIMNRLLLNPILQREDMIPARRAQILQIIKQKGEITIGDLTKLMKISGTVMKKEIEILISQRKIEICKDFDSLVGKGRPPKRIRISSI